MTTRPAKASTGHPTSRVSSATQHGPAAIVQPVTRMGSHCNCVHAWLICTRRCICLRNQVCRLQQMDTLMHAQTRARPMQQPAVGGGWAELTAPSSGTA